MQKSFILAQIKINTHCGWGENKLFLCYSDLIKFVVIRTNRKNLQPNQFVCRFVQKTTNVIKFKKQIGNTELVQDPNNKKCVL